MTETVVVNHQHRGRWLGLVLYHHCTPRQKQVQMHLRLPENRAAVEPGREEASVTLDIAVDHLSGFGGGVGGGACIYSPAIHLIAESVGSIADPK